MRVKAPELTKAKETAILDAAQVRFAHYGVEKVTMDEIAADAGMGKATLYYYFPGKEEVYCGVISREQTQFLDRLRKIVASDLAADKKLLSYIRHRLRYFKGVVNLNALSEEVPQMKPVPYELYCKFTEEECELIAQILREGNKKKQFQVVGPEAVAEVLLHALHGLRLRAVKIAYQVKKIPLDYKALEQEMSLLTELIIKGIQHESTKR